VKKLIVLCGVLAGCATQQDPRVLEQQSLSMTTLDLCYYAVSGNNLERQASGRELTRRGSTCQAEMPIVWARLQNDQARRAAYMQWQAEQQRANRQVWQQNMLMMQNARQQPAPAPTRPPLTCTSQEVMGQVQTYCQ
jgi:hypothetical protein